MRSGSSLQIQDLARHMRRHATPAESRLWQALRNRQLGVKFRRQMPIGPYIIDFASSVVRLAVEVDGDHHDGSETDARRDDWLHDQGWQVIRLRNETVIEQTDAALDQISAAIKLRLHDLDTAPSVRGGSQTGGPLQPPPQAGEGSLIQT